MLCGLSDEIERIVEGCIKEKFKNFLDKRLSEIEKRLDDHDKAIENNLGQSNSSISSLFGEIEGLNSKLKVWKQEIELTSQGQLNLLISQFNSDIEEINLKIKEINHIKKQSNQILPYQSPIAQALATKGSEILRRLNNDPEIEQDFRKTCSLHENSENDPIINQAYEEYIKSYYQITSLYFTSECNETTTYLNIYDTENEREDVKILETLTPLNKGTCITQLPNGELFCFGKCEPISGVALIVDRNLRARQLPFGPFCYWSSAIYFQKNVYCFGGTNYSDNITLSARFDLEENRWIKLNPMPQEDYLCNSIVFNKNILISGHVNQNLLIYSPNIDSFSIIPYNFEKNSRKVFANLERLYMIETYGRIYESDGRDEYTWTRIASSIISYSPVQVYLSYNKGEIYIGCLGGLRRKYFKFNLEKKMMVKI